MKKLLLFCQLLTIALTATGQGLSNYTFYAGSYAVPGNIYGPVNTGRVILPNGTSITPDTVKTTGSAALGTLGIVPNSGWTALPRNDDGFTTLSLPFTYWLGNKGYTTAYISNNGVISFDAGLSSYISQAFPIPGLSYPIIAPLWCDVDTRYPLTYGTTNLVDTVHNRVYYKLTGDRLVVVWDSVSFYGADNTGTYTSNYLCGTPNCPFLPKLNKFQAMIGDNSRPKGTGKYGYDMAITTDTVAWAYGTASANAYPSIGAQSYAGSVNMPGSRTATLLWPFNYSGSITHYTYTWQQNKYSLHSRLPRPTTPHYPKNIFILNGNLQPVLPYDTAQMPRYTGVITYVGPANTKPIITDTLKRPTGLAVDYAGNLYIDDRGHKKLKRTGNYATSNAYSISTIDSNSARIGVAVDAGGNVFRTDSFTSNITKHRADSMNILATYGNLAAGYTYFQPTAVAIDSNGSVYVADKYWNRIDFSTSSGSSVTYNMGLMNPIYAGTGTAGAANGAGTAATFNRPTGVALDSNGNLFVADQGNNQIRKITPAGVVSLFAGNTAGTAGSADGTGTSASFNRPFALCIDSFQNIYITDQGNNKVRMITPAGVVTTVAGSGAVGYKDTTAALYATFGGLGGIAVDYEGIVYVADTGNNVVRAFCSRATPAHGASFFYGGVTGLKVDAATGIITTDGTPILLSAIPQVLQVWDYGMGYSSTETDINVIVGAVVDSTIMPIPRPTKCPGDTTQLATVYYTGSSIKWKDAANTVIGTGLTQKVAPPATAAYSATVPSYINLYGDTAYTAGTIAVTRSMLPTPATVSSTTPCTGSTLTATSIPGPLQTQWLTGTTAVQTAPATYAATAATVAGTGTTGTGLTQLSSPNSTFVSRNGTVYVTDAGNSRVVKWAPGAATGTVVAGGNGSGTALNQLNNPKGIYVDATNTVYVADCNNHRVVKWTAGATTGTLVAGTGTSGNSTTQLSYPTDVEFDVLNYLYVADSANNRIQKFSVNGSIYYSTITAAMGGFGKVSGIKTDRNANIYITDVANSRITKVAYGATTSTIVAGNNGAGSAANQLNAPTDITVDNAGNLFIADKLNNRIQVWMPGATTGTTVSGTGQLSSTAGLALDSLDNLYVSDASGARVQKFTIQKISIYTPPVAGSYTVVTVDTNGCKTTSAPYTVNTKAAITTQLPATLAVCAGNPAVLSTAATNATGYTWLKGATTVSGATAVTYTQLNATAAVAGTYKAIAVGTGGCNDTTTAAVISVNSMATTLPTATSTASFQHLDGLTYNYTDASCELIASVVDATGGNVLGAVNSEVTIDGSVQTYLSQPYLQRHFDIAPANTGAATVTLYVTQADFDAYNAWVTAHGNFQLMLPTGPADANGINHISITQYHGLPAAGTTGPGGQYVAANSQFIGNGAITKSWNGTYWALTFPVSGFSGFFISSNVNAPLALQLLHFTAQADGAANRLDWATAQEDEGSAFSITRSANGSSFETIGKMDGKGNNSTYTFYDEQPLQGVGYYRLSINSAGEATYSNIATVRRNNGGSVTVAPIPAHNSIVITNTDAGLNGQAAVINDMAGREVYRFAIGNSQTVDVSAWAAGIYNLRLPTGEVVRLVRE